MKKLFVDIKGEVAEIKDSLLLLRKAWADAKLGVHPPVGTGRYVITMAAGIALLFALVFLARADEAARLAHTAPPVPDVLLIALGLAVLLLFAVSFYFLRIISSSSPPE